jgi:hypothetical protein
MKLAYFAPLHSGNLLTTYGIILVLLQLKTKINKLQITY